MHLEANQPEFSPSIVSQVELDTLLALKKAKSLRQIVEVRQLRCINHQLESETDFGKQIWFFEAVGVDSQQKELQCYGVLHYSVEFSLLELIQTHVFDSSQERDLYQYFCETGKRTDTPWHPANRWLLSGLTMVAIIWLVYISYLWVSRGNG